MGTLLQLMDWIMEAAKTQWLGERPAENQRRECLVGKYFATQYGIVEEFTLVIGNDAVRLVWTTFGVPNVVDH